MSGKPEENKYFHYYNANPSGKETKDCTYRALSLFLEESWDDIARLDAEFYMTHGMWLYGTNLNGSIARSELHTFLEEKGFFVKKYNACSLRDFIDNYADKNKTYLCELNGHVTIIKNAKVYDTWDSSELCSYAIYEK